MASYRPIEAGMLTKRGRFERMDETDDPSGSGQKVLTPVNLGDRWACVEALQGRSLEYARQIDSEVNHRITIRYWSAVTPTCRFVLNGRVFDIKAVINPMERNEQLQLFCVEKT